MPSNKEPHLTVVPGPGRLPADSVPASALLFVPSGGSGGALQAHINNPLDAHRATAIELNPTHDGSPLLSVAGGPYDGHSVEDAIAQLAALLPVRPNALGFTAAIPPLAPLSGAPNWGTINTQRIGGYTVGANVVFSKYIVPTATSTFALTGTVYPADRGTLALYSSSNQFTTMTLLASVWLGPSPSPDGAIPSANFNEGLRGGQQTDYTATAIDLTYRLPYLTSYTAYPGAPYPNFSTNFPAYQLAQYTIDPQAVASGAAGSFLLVHWKESVAAAIILNPVVANLTSGASGNCYSAVPTGGNFDGANVLNVNRKNVFRDPNSTSEPTGATFTAASAGGATTVLVSGVAHYTGAGLTWNTTLRVNNLFDQSYLTGSQAHAQVDAGYESAFDPVRINFVDFGGGTLLVPYHVMRKFTGGGTPYSTTNAPVDTDIGEYVNAAMAITGPTTNSAAAEALLRSEIRSPFSGGAIPFNTTTKYLYNNYQQASIPPTFLGEDSERHDTFVNEDYRFTGDGSAINTALLAAQTQPIKPETTNRFDSTVALVDADGYLQVLGAQLVYPTKNFQSGYEPSAGQPDYSGFAEGTNTARRYVRVFNAQGSATGRIRIIGLPYSTVSGFQGTGNSNTNDHTNHPGGAIVEIRAHNDSTWRDLGRLNGAGTGVLNVSPTILGNTVDCSYVLPVSPIAQGGKFPLVIRITLLKGVGSPVGQNLVVDSIQWFTS